MQAEQTSNAVIKMVISMVIFGSIGFFSEHTNVPSIELVFVSGRLLVWFRTAPHRTMEPARGVADIGLRIFSRAELGVFI